MAEAVALCDRILALKSDISAVHCNRGVALAGLDRQVEAEAAYRRAIALDPDFARAYNNLGSVLVELGRFDDAEEALRRAIALRADFAQAFSNLGNALKEQGRLSEAEAASRQAITLEPDLAEAHSNLGNALVGQSKVIEAEAAYRRAIALKPDFADAHNNLGVALKYLGRLAEARRAVERATQLAPHNASYFLSLSELKRFAVGDPDVAAMEDMAKNIEALPATRQIQLHFALAKAYEDIDRSDDAFQRLLAGNALKRRHAAYDEATTLSVLERIRTVFTPGLLGRFQDGGEPSSVPLFIVGMPRSGSTLVEQILASHPQVFGAGELPSFGKAAIGLDPTAERVFPDVMLHITGDHLRHLGARYVFEITQLAPGVAHVVDKMPSNFLFAGVIHLALPNARIIHAVRDPVDTCISCFSKLFAGGQNHTYDLVEIGRYYRHYQTLMAHWHRVLPPGRILDVRYEDVIADLEGQARRIVAHCGLAWDARCLAFHETERPVNTASAAQVRQPLYRGAIGRARLFKSYLRPLLAELAPLAEPDTAST
ncbi:MAG: sulfotransferase [Xanthobacteraceae bacterium]